MRQASILSWVKERPKRKRIVAYRFLIDIPRILDSELNEYGPFRKGWDLVSAGALPGELWDVLLKRGAVKPHFIKLDGG